MDNFIIMEKEKGERLDVFLQKKLPLYTRSHLKVMVEKGNILFNGKIVKAGERLRAGDVVEVHFPPPQEVLVKSEDIPLDIVYEDDDLAVVNKPQGMVMHPACGNQEGTLVNALLYNIKNLSGINGEIRPGIVHRLDKNTSGLLVIAKNDTSHNSLSKQIQSKTCRRIYRAVVVGKVKEGSGEIVSHIARSKTDRKKMAVCANTEGKLAITQYRVIEWFHGYTYVEFELKTGRTHQIRVHCKHLGHPIAGDEVYGYKDSKFVLKGQLLHAYRIVFEQPSTKECLSFVAPLPDYFVKVLKKLANE